MKIWTGLLAVLFVAAFWTTRVESGQGSAPAPGMVAVAPADNPTTPQKVALGRLLFWDPLLSGGRDVACASCHHPDFGYSDGLARSIGVNGVGLGTARRFVAGVKPIVAKRNSQTVLNAAFIGVGDQAPYDAAAAPMFWDNRARSLETQALEPIKSAEEMRGDAYPEAGAVDAVVARLSAIPEYVRLFASAFGGGGVTAGNLGRALAAFERSLVAVDAPFDRYQRGDQEAMTSLQLTGMREFERVGCARCHSGPMFSDFKLHVLAVPDRVALPEPDTGAEGSHAFRTPSLRNLTQTGPYMHTGALQSLDDVLRFYNRVGRRGGGRDGGGRGGGGVAPGAIGGADLDPLLRQLRGVGRSRQEIVAFLEALNDAGFDKTIPTRVPSGLRPGGSID